MIPSIRRSRAAELAVLYEISLFEFSDDENRIAREALEMATRLFGASYFALLKDIGAEAHTLTTFGFKDARDLTKKLEERADNQFFSSLGNLGSIFLELSHKVDTWERHLYMIFARQIEKALLNAKNTTERKQAEEALTHRLKIENAISRISASLVNVSDLSRTLNDALSIIGNLTDAGRSYVFLIREDGNIMDNTHEWCAQGVEPQIQNLQNLPCDIVPWWMERLRKGQTIHIADVSAMPPEAAKEKEILEMQDIKSLLVLPLYISNRLGGFIGLDNVSSRNKWSETDVSILRTVTDIIGNAIERKRAEEALHLSQITYQGIFDSVTDAIYLQDEEGNFLDVNRAAELMYGYPREYFIGKTPEFLSAPGKNDFSKIAENIRKAYEGEPQLLEFWGIREDGYVFPKDVRLSPGTYFGKKVVIAVARDITERKRTELERHAMFEIIQGVTITDNLDELLQLIHQALKKVLYAENCFIALYNHNTGLFSFPYFVDQFDTAPAPQALEKSCTSYVLRTGRPMSITEEFFQQLKEQGEIELVGTPSPSWLGVPLRTPSEKIGVLVVQHYDDEHAYTKRDVEFFASVGNQIALAIERKQAEEEIRKLYRGVEQSPASVLITDIEGNIEYVNTKFCEVTGYTYAEIIGKNPRILSSGEKPKEKYAELWNTILSGKDWKGEFHNKKKNGELYWESASISSILNDQGEITHFIAIKEDITGRKKMIEELIEAKEKAEEANRLKSGFLSAMSHEIRTPINTIIGFNSVIRDIFEDAANGEQKMFFDAIENGSLRLLNTITQILDISRIEANEFNIELISMSINKVIESVYRQVKILADKKKLGINLLLPETDVKVIADDYCLNGVLMNILSNAIKYSKKGTIEVKLEEEKDHAVCTIKDEGIGMSEGYQKHLYQSFSQEDVGFSRRYEGTGLGLALIKKYIDLMNGAIDVESKKGVGTTVTIIIPLDK